MNTTELLKKWAAAALEISKAYEAGDNDKVAELLKAQSNQVSELAVSEKDVDPAPAVPKVPPTNGTGEAGTTAAE